MPCIFKKLGWQSLLNGKLNLDLKDFLKQNFGRVLAIGLWGLGQRCVKDLDGGRWTVDGGD